MKSEVPLPRHGLVFKHRHTDKVGKTCFGQLAAPWPKMIAFKHPEPLIEVMHLPTAVSLGGTEVSPPMFACDVDLLEDEIKNGRVRTLSGCLGQEIAPLPSTMDRWIERCLRPFGFAEFLVLSFERQEGFVGLLMWFVHGKMNEMGVSAHVTTDVRGVWVMRRGMPGKQEP